MNEQRIREIANQASDHAENTVEYFPDTEDGLDYPAKMMKIRDLKFAELIVRECMACSTWVGKVNMNAIEPVHTAHAINQRIRQHFGVEE